MESSAALAFIDHLVNIRACREARDWANGITATQAWKRCKRADWLLWWAAKTKTNSRKAVVLTACACARRALKHVATGEDRPRLAIEAAERWVNDPTPENKRAAASAASAAASAADAASYAAASYAAAYAAYAAAYAASYAAAYAAASADAAYAAAYAEAEKEHVAMCKIIRKMLKQPWSEKR